MNVLTEDKVRAHIKNLKKSDTNVFNVYKNEILTPSAKSLLKENNIEINYVNSMRCNANTIEKEDDKAVTNKTNDFKYVTIFGIKVNEKPEYMTHLYGNVLVFKDNKRIVFRGKLDSLEAKILEVQIVCDKNKKSKLVDDLQEILQFVRNILKSEVLNEPVPQIILQGLTEEKLREMSHYPQKYFGRGHEAPQYTMGEIVVSLNSLRACTRETELYAYKAFKDDNGKVDREDIIKSLNRLSSLLWIMIYKYRTGKYD